MSLLDKYPGAARFTQDDWEDDGAADSDLEGAAHRATVEALRSLAPDAVFPLRLSIRLFGESVMDGAFDFRASPVLQRLDQELQVVLPEELRNEAHLQFVGVGPGSVVIHARPYFGQPSPEDELDIGTVNGVEIALRKVLDLHDSLESRSTEIKVPNERWEGLRKLTKALDAADVNLEIDMLGSGGVRRTSQISEVGRSFAREIFERKPSVFEEQLNGSVFGAELDGSIVLKVGAAKITVEDVPETVISSDMLRLGRYVRIMVETTIERDRVGGQVKEHRRFSRIVSGELDFSDLSE